MATLLRVDSSPLGGASFSRQVTDEFVQEWLASHRDGKVITRDLYTTSLRPIDSEWISAAYAPAEQRTDRQAKVLALSGELLGELKAADEYVIGAAMHNFSIPSVLKLWIDQIVRRGETFRYESTGPVGLLENKKATFVIASGGVYDAGTPTAAMDFAEPYLRSMFGFLGVKDTNFIHVGGTSRLLSGVTRDAIVQPVLDAIHGRLQAA